MNEYVPTIGLEIHAELKTQTKMFCGCKNDPDEAHPDVNVCPGTGAQHAFDITTGVVEVSANHAIVLT